MKLTPVELRKLEFKKAMRGIDPKEVNFYINQAADELERLLLENKKFSEKLERYDKLESTIKEAVLQSQEIKKTQEGQAKKEAELIIEKAKLEAEKIKGGLSELKNKRDLFLVEFKTLLSSYLSLIEKIEKEPKIFAEEKQEVPEPKETPPTEEEKVESSEVEKTPAPEPVEETEPLAKHEKPTCPPDAEKVTDDEETVIDEIQAKE